MTGKWLRIFKAVIQDPDLEWLLMDRSYIKAHQHSARLPVRAVKPLASVVQAVLVRFNLR